MKENPKRQRDMAEAADKLHSESTSPIIHPGLPKKGDLLKLDITGLHADGSGTASLLWHFQKEERLLKFKIKGALPGDHLRVRVGGRKRCMMFANIDDILLPSPSRRKAPCPHATFQKNGHYCGGCSLQELTYGSQKDLKMERVKKAFSREGLNLEIGAFIEAPEQFHHRHKMEFSFASDRRQGEGAPALLGLHPPGRKWEVVSLESCLLLSEAFSNFLPSLSKLFHDSGLSAYDPRDQKGFFRTLTVREGRRTDARLLELTTTQDEELIVNGQKTPAKAFVEKLKEQILELAVKEGLKISSFIWTQQKSQRGEKTEFFRHCLHGLPYLEEKLQVPSPDGPRLLDLHIAPNAFFQPHPKAAEALIQELISRLPEKRERVLDLYCGTGTIGLAIAPSVKHLLGIELVPEAVENAKENAALNGLSNTEFIAGDVGTVLQEKREASPSFASEVDAVVLDPPRSGLLPNARELLPELRIPRLIYVSCQPESLARDLHFLQKAGYEVEGKASLIDLFPQSHHIETMVTLKLSEPSTP